MGKNEKITKTIISIFYLIFIAGCIGYPLAANYKNELVWLIIGIAIVVYSVWVMVNSLINLKILIKNTPVALVILTFGIAIITMDVLLEKNNLHVPHLITELALRIAESLIIVGTFKIIEFLKANKNYGYLDLYESIASDSSVKED